MQAKANASESESKCKRKEAKKQMTYNRAAITTVDNPFDPFEQYEDWYRFDCDKGYNSCCYLARLTNTSEALSDVEYCKEVERAIDKILEYDPTGLYRKVVQKITAPD